MSDIELPEMPELEREIRKDKLNTLIAITVTLLVTFMAICRMNDNDIVLAMHRTQAERIDHWNWYQSVKLRADIVQLKLDDTDADKTHTAIYTALKQKQEKETAKLEDIKKQADTDDEHYEVMNKVHEQFDQSEAFISVAVSLLALTSLLNKRWMYGIALVPAALGVLKGIMGLIG